MVALLPQVAKQTCFAFEKKVYSNTAADLSFLLD
jgi:hypothetical protein